ncbi:MAG: DUF4167 domain-containing protein [Pseudomonadota bacterium]
MRNGQNKRMRGRNRNNKGHHGGGGGGGGHHHNPLTRVYESNGQDVKIRGTAHTIAEKYLQLARDATTSGDHVTAENHFQHAEHYFRLIAAAQEQFRQQNPYYQPQQAMPGAEANNDGSFEDGDEDGQPTQGQPQQGQPMQGGQQPNFNQPNYNNNQQPNYQPREQPQPSYGSQQPQQHQPRQHQPNYNNNQQPNYQPQPQPATTAESDAGGLPSFITGGQQQPVSYGQNGHDNNQNGDRFPRHRRRRHRGPGGPRPDMQGGAQDFQSDSGSDGPAN